MKKEKKEKKVRKEKKANKLLNIIKNKWLIKGTTTLLVVAIVIACYIVLNWGVKQLKIEDIDCTEKKLYSLSDETKNKVANIDKEITIQLLNMSDSSYVIEYAKKYENINKKITVEEIDDLSTRTDLKAKYGLTDTDSLIVIKNGDKEKTLTTSDLYTYDYSTYQSIDKTEEALTNAIIEVTIEQKPRIYILSGKSYYNPEQVLGLITSELTEEANEVEYLDILTTGNIPDDCDCLVITTLGQDLSDLERDKIIEYINAGGKILMLTSQNTLQIDTPNFNQVLEQYGITMGYGVVYEQDSGKMIQGSPNMIVADVKASFMNKVDMSLKICLPSAGKIEFADSDKLEELGVTYETIATTSEKAFVRTNFDVNTSSKTNTDGEEDSCIIGAYVTKNVSDDKKSQLIIYSNEIFATNMAVQIGSQYYYIVQLYNNEDVILNSISHLTEREDTITIRKTDESESYTVTDQEDVIIKTIIFVVPVFVIGIGIVVWYVRRRKE